MAKLNVEAAAAAKEAPRKKRSQLQEVWLRLKKNKAAIAGLIVFIIWTLVALLAPVLVSYEDDVIHQDLSMSLQGISEGIKNGHWLGTDGFGRDTLARIIYGARISLFFGIVSTVLGLVGGGILGCIAGYFGGKIDNIIMRIMDVFMAIPFMLLAIALVSALGTSLTNLIFIMIISSIPSNARLLRSLVLPLRGQEFIEAARAVGAGHFRIIMKHIVPNIIAPVIVQTTLSVCSQILAVSALSYLGLGVQPPMPEWGQMLSEGKQYIRSDVLLILIPGLAILSTVLSFNLMGDGLNDALDPKLKNS